MDEDGYIFLVDRKKDLIKTSGFQVWPREIEEVLSAHPAVMEVGVAGVPDAAKGEVAKAWVVLKAGADATEDELRAYCRERLAPYKVPAAVEFRKRAAQDDGRQDSAARAGRGQGSARVVSRQRGATARTSMPAARSAARSRRASSAAPGVSPWTHSVSTASGTRDPSTATTDWSSTIPAARASTASTSETTPPGTPRGASAPLAR